MCIRDRAFSTVMTSCRDAIKIFESHPVRNEKADKADEAKLVRLYGMMPPITKIDPAALSTLKACEQLGLSSNNIDKIGNLAGMENLRILSLGRNCIKKLDNLDGLGNKLEQLWISYNMIGSLAGIEKLKSLKVLYIGNNKIGDIKELQRLVELPELEEIVLYGNPVHLNIVNKDGELAWADTVLKLLPQVKKLDGVSAVEWRNKMDSGNEKQLRQVFKMIDADGGGTLDQDELRAAVKDPEIAKLMMMDPVEIEPILFKIMKASGEEEEVTFEDFCYWFKQ
eukprot:TRINITY_DN9226_c0_g1_i1.p1 TRINITY_DN9226_c0_g1~~TRINITY_DN9226_c0_g1_i1.p1  ORF type:complete len:282 (+),score=102.11 TRINITY_DN9226_c0_g1_i1:131-976(+)